MLDITDDARVRVLTLNRPEALNAFNDELYHRAGAALEEAAERDDIACVVITGTGRAFSAGQDLKEMTRMATAGPDEEIVSGFPALVDALIAFDKPLVAAVNGLGIGIGFTILPHCDIVLASTAARAETVDPETVATPADDAALAAAIRAGAEDLRQGEVRAAVTAGVAAKLRVANPRYLGEDA